MIKNFDKKHASVEIKKFEKNDLNLMKELIGKKFTDIFKQCEMFIISFGDGIEYSLHTFVFCRVKSDEDILLTSNDEYYSPKYKCLSDEAYEKDEMHKKSLLMRSIKNVKKVLSNAFVSNVIVLNNGDITIEFDNGVTFETLIDRKSEEYEYYRFMKFSPNWAECHKKKIQCYCPNIVVGFSDGNTVSYFLD